MVEDHYAKLGFTADGDLPDGGTRWVLDLADYTPPVLPMQVDDLFRTEERQAA
jgi:hypothetical protein